MMFILLCGGRAKDNRVWFYEFFSEKMSEDQISYKDKENICSQLENVCTIMFYLLYFN